MKPIQIMVLAAAVFFLWLAFKGGSAKELLGSLLPSSHPAKGK
jgi:hypothetical protein